MDRHEGARARECWPVGDITMNHCLRWLLAACVASLALGGCAGHAFVKTTYVETVSAVTLTRDRQIIVALGQDNDYVFNAPPGLGQVLSSPLKGAVQAELFGLHVQQGERITGGYALLLDAAAPPELRAQAVQIGFVAADSGRLVLRGDLIGNRHPKFPNPPILSGPLGQTVAVPITSNAGPRSPRDETPAGPSDAAMAARLLLAPVLIPILFTQVCLACR